MGYMELIASLRKAGQDKIRQIWSEVETEAENIRGETSEKLDKIKKDYGKKQDEAVKLQEEEVVSEADKKARIIKLSSEKIISDRLFKVAVSCLHELRNERYKSLFASLVNELPTITWEKVRTNPEDIMMAGEHFPESQIVPDSHITGGFEVFREKGRICINNTLKRRLERAWEDLLPVIIKDIYKEV
jgi:V/A-type H+-transporting ATPase subunit E